MTIKDLLGSLRLLLHSTHFSQDQQVTLLINHMCCSHHLYSVKVVYFPGENKAHTVERKKCHPALRQTRTAINIRNTWCIIFKLGSFNNKQHIVSELLRLALAFI